MIISRYSEEIQNLITEIEEEQDTTGRNFRRLLTALRKKAETEGDANLKGFVYYYYAGAALDMGEHSKVPRYCKKALVELLRSSDRVLTGLTYDLFGLEAHRLGCLDVAQQYYSITRTFGEGEETLLTRGILETNMGDLMADMGDYQSACGHKKKSISFFRKCEYKETTPLRIALVSVQQAMHELFMGRREDAKKTLKRVETLTKKHELDEEELNRWLLILRAQMAFADHDDERTALLLDRVVREIVFHPSLSMHQKYIYHFCRTLLEAEDWERFDALLGAVKKAMNDGTPAFERYRFAQLSIEQARATGRREELKKAYAERNRCYGLYQQDRNMVYHESIMMMQVTDDLHREQIKAQEANEALMKIAETDALTGIPNRYAMNRELEAAFDRAGKNNSYFGIGIVDIDDFKNYNDMYGHQAGDECLRATAGALSEFAHKHGLFPARYGGDEFVLVYEGKDDKEMGRLEKELLESLPVKVCQGLHNARVHESSRLWEFFSKADEALYAAKQNK